MLEIKGLKAGYSASEILHGIDFKADKSEIVSIIGPNGAGKSTLLKSIFNLCDVYSGKIKFKDKDITNLPTHSLIQEGISFVPQGRPIFSDLTVKENLEMGAFTFRDKELIQRNMDDVYSRFPILKKKEGDYAFTLSGGQQQLLNIGRALVQDPELLLLDEPSLGLAPKAMKDVFEKIQEIRDEGIAIIMVEQNAKQAIDISNRTYVLENGSIALEGNKKTLKKDKLRAVYFGGA